MFWDRLKSHVFAIILLWFTIISTFAISGGDRYKAAHDHFGNKGMSTTTWIMIGVFALILLFFIWKIFKKNKTK